MTYQTERAHVTFKTIAELYSEKHLLCSVAAGNMLRSLYATANRWRYSSQVGKKRRRELSFPRVVYSRDIRARSLESKQNAASNFYFVTS